MRRTQWAGVALAAAFGVGLGLRLLYLAGRPSLWLDEARLALNVAARSYAALLQPLDYDQSAPVLFLWAQKVVTQLLGVGDLTLRLVSIIAGLAAFGLVYPVARRLLSPRGAILAVWAAAIAAPLIQYTNETKQYGMDVCFTLLLVYSALRWLERPESRRAASVLVLLGVTAPWISMPAVFTIAAIWLVVLIAPNIRSKRVFLLVAAVAWGVSLGAAYLLTYQLVSANPYLHQYWSPMFLTPGRPGLWDDIVYAFQDLFSGMIAGRQPRPLLRRQDVLVNAGTVLVLAAVMVGGMTVARRRGAATALLLAGPVLLAFVASAVGLYPVGYRLMLFTAPLLQMMALAALDLLSRQRTPVRLVATVPLGALLLVQPLPASLAMSARSMGWEHMRPAVERFERLARADEPIYVFAASLPAWVFYTTDWNTPDTTRLALVRRLGSSGGVAFENGPPRHTPIGGPDESSIYRYGHRDELIGVRTGMQGLHGRPPLQVTPDDGWVRHEAARIQAVARPNVWLVFSHFYGPEMALLHELKRLGGQRVYDYQRDGVLLFEYRFDGH